MSKAVESVWDVDPWLMSPESLGVDSECFRRHCRFPGICEHLSHYYVFQGFAKGDASIAIGEAAFVRLLSPGTWLGIVVLWTEYDQDTRQTKRRPFRNSGWRVVKLPRFGLVEKEIYCGEYSATIESVC